MSQAYRDISPTQLKGWLDSDPESVYLLDVREPHEHQIASVDAAVLIPMKQVQARADEIPTDRRVVVMCHHGGRSAMICQSLASAGIERLYNLAGGIHQWSAQVDPSVPRY